MYDHTINRLPYENPRFHWKKIGISGKKTSYNLKDLDTLIIENNHISEKNMILKLDVEHWEWPAINDLDEATLKKFKYILVEYHFYGESNPEYKIYYNVMKKLFNHFMLVVMEIEVKLSNLGIIEYVILWKYAM